MKSILIALSLVSTLALAQTIKSPDQNKDGKITLEEAKIWMKQCDISGDGTLNASEAAACNISIKDFNAMDIDKNGSLSVAEIAQMKQMK
ncbi:hypothetical protein [Polynucleobacter antarcticus]|uniref:EF-hand domain-containing protein n=1 Tax=Polynucleobacter antarcticus TaxID=1743162 RepID=A0A6M9PS88_9BURK|nr:hypothetical protein [Polynucleobacter antarcticus]QKM63519.1 hypothetical protein DCO16_11010 [Polynucleobacter antarcticus]